MQLNFFIGIKNFTVLLGWGGGGGTAPLVLLVNTRKTSNIHENGTFAQLPYAQRLGIGFAFVSITFLAVLVAVLVCLGIHYYHI